VTAINAAGSASQTSQALTITSLKPVATTGVASSVSATGSVLNGTVNPQNSATGYHFDYGTSTAYGSRTGDAMVGTNFADHPVSQAISGLRPGTI
jgi:hypothetical protein